MNNLVKQQGCAGSGVTSFTPHWQAFLLSKRGGSRNQNLSPLKRRPHITYLCSPVCLSCPPLPRATEFPFLLLFNHRQHCIFPVNGHHDRGGCRALCPGKAVLHAASVTSYLSWMQDIRKGKKNKTCSAEGSDKTSRLQGNGRLRRSMISSVQQLQCHPISSDTQGMQVRGSWKARVCTTQGLWFHTPVVGVCILTP